MNQLETAQNNARVRSDLIGQGLGIPAYIVGSGYMETGARTAISSLEWMQYEQPDILDDVEYNTIVKDKEGNVYLCHSIDLEFDQH